MSKVTATDALPSVTMLDGQQASTLRHARSRPHVSAVCERFNLWIAVSGDDPVGKVFAGIDEELRSDRPFWRSNTT